MIKEPIEHSLSVNMIDQLIVNVHAWPNNAPTNAASGPICNNSRTHLKKPPTMSIHN